MYQWWRENAWWLTLSLTLVMCAFGLAYGVSEFEVVGLFLFGLVLTVLNRPKRNR